MIAPDAGRPCPLCDADELRRDAFVLENDLVLFSQKPGENGALDGAGIIVPKAHRPTPFDLTPDEWAATRDLLLEVRAFLDRSLAPDGYTLGWNVGGAGGQVLPHAHLHVLPRFADEPLAGRGLRHHLKQPWNRRSSAVAAEVDALLRAPGGNVALADGLLLAPRWWVGPLDLPLAALTRPTGPEANAEFFEGEANWGRRVADLLAALAQGWVAPPLVVEWRSGELSIRDGSHRLAALTALGRAAHPVYAWFNAAEDRDAFLEKWV